MTNDEMNLRRPCLFGGRSGAMLGVIGFRSADLSCKAVVMARSANTTIAVGDEERGTHGKGAEAHVPRSRHHKLARIVMPLRGMPAFVAIRGFLEDSSPTAIVVQALRASIHALAFNHTRTTKAE